MSLVTRSGYPKYAVKTVAAYAVNDGLKNLFEHIEVGLGIGPNRTVGQFNAHRLIGQLKHNFMAITNAGVTGYNVPNSHQVVGIIVVVFNPNHLRSHTGRAHNDVQPFAYGVLGHGNKNFIEVLAKSVFVETIRQLMPIGGTT